MLKRRLTGLLQTTIAPIRERRAVLSLDTDFLRDVLRTGTAKARFITEQTKGEIVAALGLFRL